VTIARITEATARATARPEIKAKYQAWNQSRIGKKLPEDQKVSVALDVETNNPAAPFLVVIAGYRHACECFFLDGFLCSCSSLSLGGDIKV
jgi:hypothetical protein